MKHETVSRSTPPVFPPREATDEVDSAQLSQARSNGNAYAEAVEYMANRVADSGGKLHAGEYVVAWAQERAEGMYHMIDGALVWRDAGEDVNCHMEIAVMDAADQRFLPGLEITCILTKGDDRVEFSPAFLWHPGLYHYGCNILVPGDGLYDLEVRIAAPMFHRHDRVNGRRYATEVLALFPGIAIRAGRE